MVGIGDETLQRQPLWVRLLFGLGVIAVIPAITLGGLWIVGQFRDDPTATAVAPLVTASPTGDVAVDATTSPTVEASPSPTAPPSPSPAPPPSPPPPTSSPPSSPSPTALAPLVPYSGTPPTTDAEVRAIYDQMVAEAGKIGLAPDPRKIDALYSIECRCYQPFREGIEGRQQRGEYAVGNPAEVRSFEVRSIDTDPQPRWSVRTLIQIDQNGKTYNPAGEIVEDGSDVGPEDLIVSAVSRDGGWYFTQVDRIAE